MTETAANSPDLIAVVGMSSRLPGAPDIDVFWRDQMAMREGARWISYADARTRGRTEDDLRRTDFVAREATIDDVDRFDASFFGVTAAEAEVMDPQIRLLHEVAWTTLEDAGCRPDRADTRIGVFAAANISTYWLDNLAGRYRGIDPNELLHLVSTNSQDYLATTLAYRLGLTGPALNIQTACSSGLVLASVACQHLLDGSCDAALVLAASITLPQGGGYFSTADSIFAVDGVCRPFDADASGTFASDGVCGILLKRLDTAQEADDRVLAVIRGWALNNDGRRKIGFFAPSIDGQREVLLEAAAAADIAPGDLDYIETHGTGTKLGDPIEVEAIKAVHGRPAQPGRRLGLSSVKSAIGHLGPAAGLCGLLRAALALHTGMMPGTLNFKALNPAIRTADTQIFVVQEPQPFPQLDRPPRAGVSSFGIGGTNAHMVLEGYPAQTEAAADDVAADNVTNEPMSDAPEVLALSGVDAAALERRRTQLLAWLQATETPVGEPAFPSLTRIADTAMHHRVALPYRQAVVGASRQAIAEALARPVAPERLRPVPAEPKICFVFTGSGVPALTNAQALADMSPPFAAALREIDDHLAALGYPPVTVWLKAPKSADDERDLTRSHVAAFAFGYAHARMWQALGIDPALVLGHSMGEIAAACIGDAAGLKDALAFTAERAGIIQALASDGELLAVAMDRVAVGNRLDAFPGLSIAGENGVGQSLVAGPRPGIAALRDALRGDDIPCSVLPAGRPFHSPGMAATRDAIALAAEGRFGPSCLPIASTVTGSIETAAVARSAHWSNQMTTPVDLTGAIDAALSQGCTLFLELGPRPTFAVGGGRTLMDRNSTAAWRSALNLEPDAKFRDVADAVAQTRAHLFEHGFPSQAPHRRRARKTVLPSYPFARHRYWRDAHRHAERAPTANAPIPRTEIAGSPAYDAVADPCGQPTAESLLRDLLADIWRQELGRPQIDGRDSFVGLGGTSLAALKVVGVIERQLGMRPPLASLTTAPTFDDFVSVVADLLIRDEAAERTAPIAESVA